MQQNLFNSLSLLFFPCSLSSQEKVFWKAGAQLGGNGEEASPTHFWKSKKVPGFWKKGPDCIHLCVKFSIQNVVLRISRTKKFQIFPCGASFSCVFDEVFIEVSKFHETSPVLKNFWLRAWKVGVSKYFCRNS